MLYSEIGWEEKKYRQYEKYISNNPDYYIRNEYMYITQRKGAEMVFITGLFEDPWMVNNYDSLCAENNIVTCQSPLDMDFPIDGDMIDTLVELTAMELIGVFTQAKEDVQSNTRDDADRKIQPERADRRVRRE